MLLPFLSASECKNIQTIPCPTFADICLAIRALTSVNILANYIGTERANELIEVLDRSEQLETLCGFKGDETELNLWGVRFVPWCGVLLDTHEVRRGKTTMLGADGAIMLAPEIAANGALTSLNIISNRLGAEGATHIAAVLPECT